MNKYFLWDKNKKQHEKKTRGKVYRKRGLKPLKTHDFNPEKSLKKLKKFSKKACINPRYGIYLTSL